MARLLNAETGLPEDVPDELAAQALMSGAYGFAQGSTVTLRDADNKPVQMPAEQAYGAIQEGFRIEGTEEERKRVGQETYGTGAVNELAAAGAGAARGLTFGLSDLAATDLGIAEPETLAGLKEFNPGASAGGEIAGAAIPLIFSGGASSGATAASQGVRAAGSAVRGVAALGGAVERGVASALTRTGSGVAGQIARAVAPKVAGGAVEGAFYGAGQEITESALGDTELTAEKLLAGAGLGALTGGIAGGAFGLGGFAAGKAASGVKRLGHMSAESIESLYKNTFGEEAAAGLGQRFVKKFAKASSAASGGDEATIATLLTDKSKRALATADDDVIEQAARDLADTEDQIGEIFKKVSDEGRGQAKLENFKPLVKAGNEAEVHATARQLLDEVGGRLDEMLASGTGEFGYAARLKDARRQIEKTIGHVDGAVGGADANANVFWRVDNLKRDLGKMRAKMRVGATSSSADRAAAERFEEIYKTFQGYLEDAALHGEAGVAQQKINAAWTPFLGNNAYEGNKFFYKAGEEAFEPVFKADAGKYDAFLRNLTSPAKDADYAFLAKRHESRSKLLEELQQQLGKSELGAEVARAKELSGKFGKLLEDSREQVVWRNQLRKLEQSANAPAGASVVGAVLGGVPGAVLGGLAGAAARPGQTIRQLAAIDRLTKGIGEKLQGGVKGFLENARTAGAAAERAGRSAASFGRKATVPAATEILDHARFGADAAATVADDDTSRDRSPQMKAFRKRASEIQALMTNPERLTDHVGAMTEGIAAVAPQTSAQLAAKATGAIKFLYDRMPKDTRPQNPLIKRQWTPPESEVNKFARYVAAVSDPMSVLEDLKERRLSGEGVEVLQEIYPKLYQELTSSVVQALSEEPAKFSYQDRVQLSLFLNQPLDPTMEPAAVASMQARWAQTPQPQPGQGGGGVRLTGIENVKADKTIMTRSQELSGVA